VTDPANERPEMVAAGGFEPPTKGLSFACFVWKCGPGAHFRGDRSVVGCCPTFDLRDQLSDPTGSVPGVGGRKQVFATCLLRVGLPCLFVAHSLTFSPHLGFASSLIGAVTEKRLKDAVIGERIADLETLHGVTSRASPGRSFSFGAEGFAA
jgi:hypothetical protein